MGFGEVLVKVVFYARFRKAKKIGEAAELIGQGRAKETLELLERIEKRIPPYLGHLFFLTRARALDELGRIEEAEQNFTAAVFAREGATLAHLHLAVLCGKQRRFDDARAWLSRIRDDDQADEALLEQTSEVEAMLDEVEDGRRLADIEERAARFAEAHGLDGLDQTAALEQIDAWV
ncbi:MAG: hypothetical protein HQ506_12940, partial [Candidatus Marinimicrobia bacterium]|nr:hypothetical protein [Candidatus Neomarinimicrobiota bacterium]